MQVRWANRSRGQRRYVSLCLTSVVIVSALGLSACSHGGTPASTAGPKHCGTSRSAADVPVAVSVSTADVSCTAAMAIEHAYARAIDEGKAPGNGGGGPVPVDGWTCQGFPTPVVLKTGNASKCTKHGTEILATLSTPT